MKKNKQIIVYLLAIIMIGAGFFFGKVKKEKAYVVPIEKKIKIDGFVGDKGEKVEAENNLIKIEKDKVSDGDLHAFNFYSEKEKKIIYFFVVRASDGSYRVVANACEVCFGSKKGFSQVGGMIRCENCQITYSKDQIGLEKGGCNPRPINADAKIVNGNLEIGVLDVEGSADLF